MFSLETLKYLARLFKNCWRSFPSNLGVSSCGNFDEKWGPPPALGDPPPLLPEYHAGISVTFKISSLRSTFGVKKVLVSPVLEVAVVDRNSNSSNLAAKASISFERSVGSVIFRLVLEYLQLIFGNGLKFFVFCPAYFFSLSYQIILLPSYLDDSKSQP